MDKLSTPVLGWLYRPLKVNMGHIEILRFQGGNYSFLTFQRRIGDISIESELILHENCNLFGEYSKG
ncbi:hypothetical protein LIHA111178_13465 [Litorimonas haliclonae]